MIHRSLSQITHGVTYSVLALLRNHKICMHEASHITATIIENAMPAAAVNHEICLHEDSDIGAIMMPFQNAIA